MRRLLLASVGCMALAVTALAVTAAPAADMSPSRSMPPARAPVYMPFFSWSGFYVGINGGYGWGQSNWTDTVTLATTGNFDISGGLVGGTVGYNLEAGRLVFGLESDFDWGNIKGSTATGCATICETSSDWLGTLRGRVGYGLERFLPYVTAGLAYGHVKGAMAGVGGFGDGKVGWTAGGGLEYAFVANFSAKIEYLYVDLGNAGCGPACSGGNPFDVSFESHLIRGGLNYRF